MADVLVAKRKVNESWRDALRRRARLIGRERMCLELFDRELAEGKREFEAAYVALRECNGLWTVDGPERPFAAASGPQEGA